MKKNGNLIRIKRRVMSAYTRRNVEERFHRLLQDAKRRCGLELSAFRRLDMR